MPQIPLTRLLQQAKRSLGSFFRHHLPWNSGTLFACLVLFILPRSLFHWPYFKNNQLLDAWTKDAFKNVRVWLFCLKKVRGRELQFLRTLVCLPESGPQADQAEVLAKWNCQFPLKKGVGGLTRCSLEHSALACAIVLLPCNFLLVINETFLAVNAACELKKKAYN